ncbi:hypothetical protein GOP47_0009252 [Adiantum capillus-veneris]|uniref:Uncharacterized protein n=1 Tax=Adiantum capillus-veneris TaxID=13818 RepID=A0A9D4ZJC6_ADICA|nr:hypothetical protein GOP47_0009252 [Adiantum capillus-veneris]
MAQGAASRIQRTASCPWQTGALPCVVFYWQGQCDPEEPNPVGFHATRACPPPRHKPPCTRVFDLGSLGLSSMAAHAMTA